MTAPLRVGVVGARRVRQGLGPFVARELASLGVRVPCVLGSSEASADVASREVASSTGQTVQGYTELCRMIERERLDALAILSPHPTHEPCLAQALEARLHVLCEKPLIYGGEMLAERGARWVQKFRDAGLLLVENTQWPHALQGYAQLYPGALDRPPKRFDMLLSPNEPGIAMLVDSISHPLSMLQALAPAADAELENIAVCYRDDDALPEPRLVTGFDYRAGETRIRARVELRLCETPPRPAGFGLDGRFARREIRLPEYAIYLQGGERSVRVQDPLTVHVKQLVTQLEAVRAGAKPADPAPIAQRLRLFEQMLGAFERCTAASEDSIVPCGEPPRGGKAQ